MSSDAKQGISSTTTGADGGFGFSQLTPGQYRLTVSKSGFQTFQANAPITILPDSVETTSVAASLNPDGAISGRILDWDGEAVAGAEVRAYAVINEIRGARLSPIAQTESNDLGEYRLFDLPAGKYVVQASPPRGATPAAQFYADTPAVYYPAVAEAAQASPIDLNWGDEVTRSDLRMVRGRSYVVAGIVWDAFAEAPCGRCLIQAIQHDSVYDVSLPQAVRARPDGAFAFRGLSPGDYTVVAQRGRGGGAVGQIQVSVRNRPVDDARLVIGMRQEVTGRVVLENAPEGIDTTDWVPRLSPVGLPPWWPRGEGEIAAGRQFKIGDVSPARYHFEVTRLPAGAYLKLLRSGGRALPGPEILVLPDSPVSGLEAVVAFDGATVQGKASTHKSQTRIYLMPKDPAGFQVSKTAEVAADGSFKINSIPPGDYTLYEAPAASPIQPPSNRDAVQIHVDPKQTVTVGQ